MPKHTLMINTSLLDGADMPKSWAELADPKWNGKIIVANPNNSYMGFTVSWGLWKALDEKTYKTIVSNLVVTESSSGVQKAVAMGEYAIGIGFEWNAYNYIAGGQDELKVVYPAEGTFLSTEYAGLVKNAPAGDAAKKAIDVLLSKDTQIELLKVGFRRPSRSDINVTDYVQMPALDTIKTIPIDELAAADAREGFLKEWDALPKAGESK
ncbi:extracellular solute-binding protein [Shinella sp. PSBB067]|uniref:extracellular solute-binding protein n=1 Tax=Shinella TaxID=323620 RepID=UPI00193B6B42|nr:MULTISPECIES: extracellular solute-binding protein [Shinella]QRI62537.1 extracellular solute-binding protein [Shinella sp. PSBB067]